MKEPTQPRGGPADDSLAMVAEQDRQLLEILTGWYNTTPGPDVEDSGILVRSAYKRGTYGLLIIEHAALRIAAKRDVARVLYNHGAAALADEFLRHMAEVRQLVNRLDKLARGVNAVGVAASLEFAGTVGELVALLRADLNTEPAHLLPGIEAALGEHRKDLHSANWIRHHAPTHPAPRNRWYSRVPVLVRVKSRYDHLRGFPWADSAPMADPKVAKSIDTES
jgi:hypothetical protein